MSDAPNPPAAEVWTIRRVLEWTASHLKKNGSDSPRLDAEVLLAFARKCQRIQLYTAYDEVLPDGIRKTMRELVQRRAAAEPVAYLVGHREFFSLNFRVTKDVLIPRPDTEILVLAAIEALKPLAEPRILELGTGSGCIAVTLAKHLPAASISAVDISPEALVLAAENAKNNGVEGRIRFMQGDLFSELSSTGPFDAVVSNPPYIATAEIDTLDREVKDHEPRLALDGGADGLNFYRRIVAEVAPFLKTGGRLLLECSPEQAGAISDLLAEYTGWEPAVVKKDLAGRPRVVSSRRAQRP